MKTEPTWGLGRAMVASVFIVMGLYRLLAAYNGAPTPGSTLVFSSVEAVLGLLIATGWKLRWTATLAALLMAVDAVVSHPFWSVQGAERGMQLLHFMKNVGLIGGLVLLAGLPSHRRRHHH
jgi:putative oxidoreductase